jgi:uncharacterized membrane protein YedE/YeeE
MRIAVALVAGLLFGLGLTISHMIDPAKVLAFLDVAGNWDPSLALVMAGALFVATPAFRAAGRRGRPFYGDRFDLPTRRDLDRRLVFGALIFGAGWGLVGYCPGPALASLSFGIWQPWLFVAAMLAGMTLQRLVTKP